MELFRIEQYLNNTIDDQIKKVKEELAEVEAEIDKFPHDHDKLTEEVGDLLQAVYTLSLVLKLCPKKISAMLKDKFVERGVL